MSPVFKLPLRVFEFCGDGSGGYVVISARAHPGETLQSITLDSLVTDLIKSEFLTKQKIKLVVIPVLNIDGVYHGNYRSDCVGQNINRTYGLTDEKFIINKSVMEFVAELKR